ncbi:MAG: Unknown protein [uncultured Sulfurovum sp.]|uniref:ABC transmembrane type-1 domain-containing protein n=1 Tax=uncultured Sulfurovum sp. TaxID=269237 RepID=A0A6S6T0I9_9BACT|nr:MAG: Unknown protein [uncultured Sulfurovum sp.]
MDAKRLIKNVSGVLSKDKKNIFYLFYYSFIEAFLLLAIPLASTFIINSVLAHATISIFVLGSIVIIIFILITLLQMIQVYIIEKFEQKIFITTGIEIALLAILLKDKSVETKQSMKKYMNYFFDITSIQKIFPILILDGVSLVIKVIVSLLLLLLFSPVLFVLGLVLFFLFLGILLFLGRNGPDYAINRSNAKHSAIYCLQQMPQESNSREEVLKEFDNYLEKFVEARQKIFRVVFNQLAVTYFLEGLIFSSFLIVGGYLVVEGKLPIGEFVAAEIITISITYAIKGFMKQVDYIYDMIEGLYKIDKLSLSLGEKIDEK